MSFTITYLYEKKVIYFVENRHLYHLKRYIKRFTKKARKSIKSITINIYQPYISLIKEMKTEYGLIIDAISINNAIKETYEIYQILLQDFKTKNIHVQKNHLVIFRTKGSIHIRTVIETMLKDFEYVTNSLKYNCSNDFAKGTNNFIKVLMIIAFG